MKRQQGFAVLEAILILVVVVVLGIAYYLVLYAPHHKNEPVKQMISKLKLDIPKQTDVKLVSAPNDMAALGVTYQVTGEGYFASAYANSVTKAQFLGEDKSSIANAGRRIRQSLQNNGFQPYTLPKWLASTDSGNTTYTRGDDICVASSAQQQATVACVTRARINQVGSTAKAFVQPFIDGYTYTKYTPSQLSFGNVDISSSKTPGYYWALVGIGGADKLDTGAYFYKHDNGWKYVTTTQEGLSCNDISHFSAEAQTALKGACYDDSQGY